MAAPIVPETTETSKGTTKIITIFILDDGWKGENPRMLIDDKGFTLVLTNILKMAAPLDALITITRNGKNTVVTLFIGNNGWTGNNPNVFLDDTGLHMDLVTGVDGNVYHYNEPQYTTAGFILNAAQVVYNRNRIIVTLIPNEHHAH